MLKTKGNGKSGMLIKDRETKVTKKKAKLFKLFYSVFLNKIFFSLQEVVVSRRKMPRLLETLLLKLLWINLKFQGLIICILSTERTR